MSKQEEIIEVAGKKVVVRYTRDGFPCVKCVFNKTISLCQCIIDRCGEFDLEKDGDELAYFVEAEYPQEKDDREFCKNNCKGFRDTGGRCFADGDCKAKQEADLKVSIGIGTDTWFQQLKIGDKVETYDGRIEIIRKKYDDSFMLGFDAEGRKNCAPDGYYPIAVSECRPFVDQPSSIAPEADLEAEIQRAWREEKESGKYVDGSFDDFVCFQHIARHFAKWERKRILDKVVEWMKANLTYTHPRKGVETCMVNIPAFLDAMNE